MKSGGVIRRPRNSKRNKKWLNIDQFHYFILMVPIDKIHPLILKKKSFCFNYLMQLTIFLYFVLSDLKN